ncbi:hypothetical protein BJX61DRAFT_296034 [Aspergillus egyptiacus]|nr:hypothetical protein BJX61DRAFT_296034 [Aspergillus egyptiacus]
MERQTDNNDTAEQGTKTHTRISYKTDEIGSNQYNPTYPTSTMSSQTNRTGTTKSTETLSSQNYNNHASPFARNTRSNVAADLEDELISPKTKQVSAVDDVSALSLDSDVKTTEKNGTGPKQGYGDWGWPDEAQPKPNGDELPRERRGAVSLQGGKSG